MCEKKVQGEINMKVEKLIAMKIREEIKRSGLKKIVMARRIGVHPAVLSRILAGRQPIGLKIIQRLLQAGILTTHEFCTCVYHKPELLDGKRKDLTKRSK